MQFLLLPQCFPLFVIGYPFNYGDFLFFDKICSKLSAAELPYEGKGPVCLYFVFLLSIMCLLLTGQCGQLPSRPSVILIGTHADKVGCPKNARGEYVSPVASSIFAKVQQKFKSDIDLVERVFVMDTQVAMTIDVKALKQQLYHLRAGILRVGLQFGFVLRVALHLLLLLKMT